MSTIGATELNPSDIIIYNEPILKQPISLQGVNFDVVKWLDASMLPLNPHDWKSDYRNNLTNEEGITYTQINFSQLIPVLPSSILQSGAIPSNPLVIEAGEASKPQGGYESVFKL